MANFNLGNLIDRIIRLRTPMPDSPEEDFDTRPVCRAGSNQLRAEMVRWAALGLARGAARAAASKTAAIDDEPAAKRQKKTTVAVGEQQIATTSTADADDAKKEDAGKNKNNINDIAGGEAKKLHLPERACRIIYGFIGEPQQEEYPGVVVFWAEELLSHFNVYMRTGEAGLLPPGMVVPEARENLPAFRDHLRHQRERLLEDAAKDEAEMDAWRKFL
eukprot:gene126-119_t